MNTKQQIRNALTDPGYVLERLGLMEGAKRGNNGYAISCLWHAENDASCNIRQHPSDGTLSVHCFGCEKSGDVFDLIGVVHGLDASTNFTGILDIAGRMAGIDVNNNEDIQLPPKRVVVPPKYPPSLDVRKLWDDGIEPDLDDDAKRWFEYRGYNIDTQLCRVWPKNNSLPEWAKFKNKKDKMIPWSAMGYRLIFPLYDSDGVMKSVKARCIRPDMKLKTANPRGYNLDGLCFADKNTLSVLQGKKKTDNVFFVEGEADMLAFENMNDMPEAACIGVYSGGLTKKHCEKFAGSKIVILTDRDTAGRKHEARIRGYFEGQIK